MPGADDFVAFDDSLPQRAATMEAAVVHGGDDAVDVGDADDFVAVFISGYVFYFAGKFFGFTFSGKLGFGSEADEVGHGRDVLQ